MGGSTTALSKAMRVIMSLILAFSLSIGYELVEASQAHSTAYAADTQEQVAMTVYNAAGETVKAYTADEMAALAEKSTDNTAAVNYMVTTRHGATVYHADAKQYVTYKTLLEDAGVKVWTSVDGSEGTGESAYGYDISSDVASNGKFFPAYSASSSTDTSGAADAPAAIALKWSSSLVTTTAGAAAEAAAAETPDTEARSFVGMLEADYSAGNIAAGKTSVKNVNSATFTADISKIGMVDCGKQFYTGSAITPYSGSVKSDMGRVKEGTDFTVTYANNTEIGTATATITGIGNFTGSFQTTFEIAEYQLSVTNSSGETLGTLSKSQLEELAKQNTENVFYQMYDGSPYRVLAVAAGDYVTIPQIIEALKISDPTSIKFEAPDGFGYEFNAANVTDGYFYPAQTSDAFSAEGKVKVPAVIALRWTSEAITSTAQDAANAAIAKTDKDQQPRGFFGATEDEYAQGQSGLMGRRFVTNADDLVFTYDISKIGISDCGNQFYTGSAITPFSGRIKSNNGRIKEGTDYTVEYTNNVEKGTATAVLKGIGNYSGEITFTFNIVDYVLTVTDEAGTVSKTFSKEDLKSLAAAAGDNTAAVSYQYGTNVIAVPAKQYVTVADIATAAGINNVVTVTITAPDGFSSTYDGSLATEGYFFPGQTTDAYATEGKVAVPDVLALQWASEAITTTAQAASDAALASTNPSVEPRGLRGATEEDYTAGNIYGNRFVTNVNDIKIESQWDIANISIPDCGLQFTNDGAAIQPYSGTINKTANGRIKEGTDYTVTYKNNTEPGTATAVITGIGNYKGSVELTFEIEDYIFTLSVGTANNGYVQKTYTRDYLKMLAETSTDNGEAVRYQGGSKVYVSPAKSYITVDSLMKDAGLINWTSISFGATDGWQVTITAEDNANGKFFPAQTADAYATDGAVAAPAVLALKWESAEITSTASDAADAALKSENMSEVPRNFVGATQEDYAAGKARAGRFNQNVYTAYANAQRGVVNDGATTLFGEHRYGTMDALVSQGFGVESCYTVVLTSGKDYPDALTAASFAGAYDAPVLITDTDSLSDEALNQIKRLGAVEVQIVGGVNSVSDNVVAELTSKAGIAAENIKRTYGENRQETALKTFDTMSKMNGVEFGVDFDTVIVASGANFADSLSASSYAYAMTTPIVLTDNEGNLGADVIAAIKADTHVKNIVIAGGTNSVSNATRSALEAEGLKVTRLGGSNRYETSNMIASWALANGNLRAENVFVADGRNFPDALTGAALAGKATGILVLASPNEGDSAAIDGVVAANAASIDAVVFMGGELSIPQSVKDATIKAAQIG